MLKVLKEIFIYILLIALIVLIFGILFYEQLPSNKLVPGKVEYTLPERLEEELQQTLEDDEEEILVTYTIDEEDLDKYEKSKDYVPGKVDPFSDYTTNTTNSVNNNTTGNTNNGNTNNNTSNSGNNNSSNNGGTSGGGQLTEIGNGK